MALPEPMTPGTSVQKSWVREVMFRRHRQSLLGSPRAHSGKKASSSKTPTADKKTRHSKAPVALEGRGLRMDFTQREQFLWRPSTLPLRAGRMLKGSVCFKATFSNVIRISLLAQCFGGQALRRSHMFNNKQPNI